MNRNRVLKKAAVMGLCITLAAGPAAYYGAGLISASEKENKAQKITETKEDNTSKDTKVKAQDSQISKQESVYVNLDASGNKKDITVTDWIKNAGTMNAVDDVSRLTGITNVKGDETFQQKGEKLTWNGMGEDIYYQGKTGDELPITMKITYSLDGKEMSPEELIGKSGRLTMKITYTNHEKDGDVYVPFAMITGVILPTEHFTNVDVDNGRIMSDADKDIVVGVALPGLEESLDLSKDLKKELSVPSSITITADTTEFELGPTFTLASSELLNDINVKDMDSYDDLKDSLEELKDASDELLDGSRDLSRGVGTLKNKSGEFINGISALSKGASKLSTGAGSLEEGVKAYTKGADTLAGGVHQMAGAVKELPKKLGKLSGGLGKTKAGAKSLVESTGQLKAGMESVNGGIDKVNETLSQVSALLSQSEAVKKDPQAAAALEAVNALAAATGEGGDLKQGAVSVENGLGQLKSGQEALESGITEMEEGVSSLAGDSDSMSSLTGALKELDEGAAALSKNSQSLINGAKDLSAGAKELKDGTASLNNGALALTDGIGELYDGSIELKNGMKEFNEEGILKLYDTIHEDLDKVIDRLDAISKAGRNYKSFAGINEDMNGTVRFIMETEEIK